MNFLPGALGFGGSKHSEVTLSDLHFRMILGCKKEGGPEQSKGLALSTPSHSHLACPPAGLGKLDTFPDSLAAKF